MKKVFSLRWLACCLLIFPLCRALADEKYEPHEKEQQTNQPKIQISTEDQKVIALMELLQKMDMLKDLDLMTVQEAKK